MSKNKSKSIYYRWHHVTIAVCISCHILISQMATVEPVPQFCEAIISSEEEMRVKNKEETEVSGHIWLDKELSGKKVGAALTTPSLSLLGLEAECGSIVHKEEAADADGFSFKMRPLFESKTFVSKGFPAVCNEKSKHKQPETLCEPSFISLPRSGPTGCSQFNLEDLFHVPSTYRQTDTFNKLTTLVDSGGVRSDQADWTSRFAPHSNSGCLETDLVYKPFHSPKPTDICEIRRDKKKLHHRFVDHNTQFGTSNNMMCFRTGRNNHTGDEVLSELDELEKETSCTDCGENTESATKSDEPLEAADGMTTQEEESANVESDVESAVKNTIEKIVHSVVLLESQRSMKERMCFGPADSDNQLFKDSSQCASKSKDLQTIRGRDGKTTLSVLVQTDWSLMNHDINHMPGLCSKQLADKAVQWEPPSAAKKKEQESLALADSTQTSETEFTESDDQKSANFCLSAQGCENTVVKPRIHYSLRSKNKNRTWNESKPASMHDTER